MTWNLLGKAKSYSLKSHKTVSEANGNVEKKSIILTDIMWFKALDI